MPKKTAIFTFVFLAVFFVTHNVKAEVDNFGQYTTGQLDGQQSWTTADTPPIIVTSTADYCFGSVNNQCVVIPPDANFESTTKLFDAPYTDGAVEFWFYAPFLDTESTADTAGVNIYNSTSSCAFLGMQWNPTVEDVYIEFDASSSSATVIIDVTKYHKVRFYWQDDDYQFTISDEDSNLIYFTDGVFATPVCEYTTPERFSFFESEGVAGSNQVFFDDLNISGYTDYPTSTDDVIEEFLDDFDFTDNERVQTVLENASDRFPFIYGFIVYDAITDAESTTTSPIITMSIPTSTSLGGLSFTLFSEDSFNDYMGTSNVSLVRNIMGTFLWLSLMFYIYKRAIRAF